MKHIISLSLKYIRRQKMRTLLTFLCVTLSVFILCTFGAYIGSTLQTLQNQCKREYGSAEADLSAWFEQMKKYDEIENAIDVIQNHVVVSDYYTSYFEDIEGYKGYTFGYRAGDSNNIMTYAEIDDSRNLKRVSRIFEQSLMGSTELNPEASFGGEWRKNLETNEGSVVSSWFEDMGYSIGDTLTFTIRPVIAEIDEDAPLMKEVRQKLLDEFGSSVMRDDVEFFELDKEEQDSTSGKYLKDVFEYYDMDFNDIPMKNTEYGEPIEVSIKIAGFFNEEYYNERNLHIISSDMDNLFVSKLTEKNPDLENRPSASADVRINENVDFDDGMEMLYEDLGFPKGNYYADLPRLNYELLFLEFRSAGSLVEALPTIIIIFVLIFFAWLIARFVIDNAFEISNQERSTQYAALRIMGASKPQIATLVFTEALFYTITAVPIGTISAYLLCSSSFKALRGLGFQDFEFKANMYFVIGGIILCIAAIFISAYTSAMWASRKLSPAEALNFGKPKKKNKKTRRRKSKIKLNSKQFLRRYTSKNIARSKGRYIISTITMALGTMFFTFSMMLGLFLYNGFSKTINNDNSYDFYIDYVSMDMLTEAEEIFGNEELFSKFNISSTASYSNFLIVPNNVNKEKFEEFFPYNMDLSNTFLIRGIDRNGFNKYIAEISGMTYDEFLQSGSAIYNVPCYGNPVMLDENDNPIRQYDDSYQALDTPLTVKYQHNNIEVDVIGSVCCGFNSIPCLIVPFESDIAEKMNLQISIEAKVNGQENYNEAEKVYNEFVEKSGSINYHNTYMAVTGFSEYVKAIVKIAITFIAAIWLVGILSMVNSINTSVLNRSRELMMLRCVGMSRKQLRKTVLLESVMFSTLASSIGIMVAIGVFFVVMTAVGAEPMLFVSMAIGLILSIAVNIIIAILAAIPGARNLEKAEALIRTF